jgi:hypothetical protein
VVARNPARVITLQWTAAKQLLQAPIYPVAGPLFKEAAENVHWGAAVFLAQGVAFLA